MGIHIRQTRMIAVVGVLAMGAASVAAAQDTSAAAPQDTSGYQQSRNQTDTMQAGAARSDTSDTSGYKYHGAASDTALKAKPGVQTGPTAADSSRMGGGQDTSSYKSGGQDTSSYKSSGGQDTSSYKSSGNQTDTSGAGQVNRTSKSGYKYHGAATDTTLKAEPGVQTGPTAGDSGRMHHRHRMRMSAMDTVVCKDGSNSANSGSGVCGSHGGVDTAATWAAMKARGGWHGKPGQGTSDTSSNKSSGTSSDTSSSSSTRSSP
jgi:hypothetical protein